MENYAQIVSNNYETLSLEEKKMLHDLFLNNEDETSELFSKLQNIIFRKIPPTPEEYLDHKNGWITKAFEESLYDHVKEDFCDILDQSNNYNQVVEYGATRTGKSFLERMIIHYMFIFVHCLRHPQLYYGLGPTTKLSIYIMSFVTEKANQLLLDPIYKLFEMSPRFKRIHLQDKVKEVQEQEGLDTIVWSKAGTGSKITVESGLTLGIGTDFLSFIGSDLLALFVSEIAFFIQQAGTTHEEIFQLYSDGLERIKATVGDNYLGLIYLDTSANDTENSIEQYILNDLQYQNKVFFKNRTRWEARPYLFPIWQEKGETFTVCTGNNKYPAKIIDNEEELKGIPKDLLIDVPIDAKEDFERNLIKAIKDIAGKPTRRENKFISDVHIIDNLFDEKIKNIEGNIICDTADNPEQFIWNIIKDQFFSKYGFDKYVYYRAPNEPRYIHLDIAHSARGDLFGFGMGHKELTNDNKIKYVIDMAFPIAPGDNGINITAVEQFIYDLINIGNIYVKQVASDSFQNKMLEQNLKRMGINIVQYSVDRTIDAYLEFHHQLHAGMVKAGRNIFLKNNLNSLIVVDQNGKEKIDHTQDKAEKYYNGNWDYSKAGTHMKDVSDTVAGIVYHMVNDNETYPSTIYEHENKKLYSEDDVEKKELIDEALSQMLSPYKHKKSQIEYKNMCSF